MAALKKRLGLGMLLRSFTVQGSWNYRTMQGAGIGFALIPVLRRLHGGDPRKLTEAVAQHAGFFNAHPYMSAVAISALARMETERTDAEEIERFKRALVGPLGALGDRLVWARWRPFCLLLAILVYLAGAAWWVASGLFLVLYNALHLALRAWGMRLGWRHGRGVGRALMGSPLRRLPDRLTIPLAVVAGALLPLMAATVSGASGIGSFPAIPIAISLTALGAWRPAVAGRAAALGMLLLSIVFIVLGKVAW
ncbi:MAG TPA: PTS system mannose/fructose/sorbose family transporter subunit IID [Gemmatimonadota bacterium]|nr:PTS system mannose/fructose/sorbose family transporter subunit IID [Gemmatimonadota bacterium]